MDRDTGALTITRAGVCKVQARATLANYADAMDDFTVNINPKDMTSFDGLAYGTNSFAFGSTVPTVTAPVSDPSGAWVTYALKTGDGIDNACTVDETTGALTPTKVGTCTIVATGSLPNYRGETDEVEVTITAGTMTLSGFAYNPNPVTFAGGIATQVAVTTPTVAPSSVSPGFAYGATGNCSVINDGSVTILGAGDCQVSVTVSATNYADVVDTVTITVNKADQHFPGPTILMEAVQR